MHLADPLFSVDPGRCHVKKIHTWICDTTGYSFKRITSVRDCSWLELPWPPAGRQDVCKIHKNIQPARFQPGALEAERYCSKGPTLAVQGPFSCTAVQKSSRQNCRIFHFRGQISSSQCFFTRSLTQCTQLRAHNSCSLLSSLRLHLRKKTERAACSSKTQA